MDHPMEYAIEHGLVKDGMMLVTVYCDSTGLYTEAECDMDNMTEMWFPIELVRKYMKDNWDVTDDYEFWHWFVEESTADEVSELYNYALDRGFQAKREDGQVSVITAYAHYAMDQRKPFGEHWFGIEETEDGKIYQKAMDWFNANQEYRGGERYDYWRTEEQLKFVWKQKSDGLQKIIHNARESGVFGAFHCGRILVEFRCNADGTDPDYHECTDDVYIYGVEDGYAYTVHDVPYSLHDYEMTVPKRRTLDGFKKACIRNFIDFLNEHTELIKYAIEETVVDEWY